MPNPYHDAEGKFCSRSESLAAVARLLASGNTFDAKILAEEVQKADEIRQFRGCSEPTKELMKHADQIIVMVPFRMDDRVAVLESYTAEDIHKAAAACEVREHATFEDWEEVEVLVKRIDGEVEAETDGVYHHWLELDTQHKRLHNTARQQLEDLYQTLVQNGVKDYEAEEAVYKWAAKEIGVFAGESEDARVLPITKELLDGTSLVDRKPAVREILEGFIDELNVQTYNEEVRKFKPHYRVYRKHASEYLAAEQISHDAATKFEQVRQSNRLFRSAALYRARREEAGVPLTARMRRMSDLTLNELPMNDDGELTGVWSFHLDGKLEKVSKDPTSNEWVLGAETGTKYYLPVQPLTGQRYMLF